ncbi:MAG: YigZ family protein [Breznakibacter sp.]
MIDIYKTVDAISEGGYKEKGSKFLSYAHPVNNEESIKNVVEGHKKRYFDARHHCYAWQLGIDDIHYRANDDGEPSGTAGKPIYGQIKSFGLTNVLIVVIRYFGGVKLGTSGLINAYKLATIDCIQNATIIEKTIDEYYRVEFGYAMMNDVMKLVKEENLSTQNQFFGLSCTLDFYVRRSRIKGILDKLKKVEGIELTHLQTV